MKGLRSMGGSMSLDGGGGGGILLSGPSESGACGVGEVTGTTSATVSPVVTSLPSTGTAGFSSGSATYHKHIRA